MTEGDDNRLEWERARRRTEPRILMPHAVACPHCGTPLSIELANEDAARQERPGPLRRWLRRLIG